MNQPTVQAELTQEQIDAIMDGDGITVTIPEGNNKWKYTVVYSVCPDGYNFSVRDECNKETVGMRYARSLEKVKKQLVSITPLSEWVIKEEN